MGVEVVGFETVEAPVEIVASSVRDNVAEEKKENGKVDEASPPKKSHEPIKFGSHVDEPVKKEANGVAYSDAANFPKDAADEWPAQKQVHSFFLVRFRQYDDPKIMSKLDQAALETEKRNQARFKITEQLKAKRAGRHELTSQLRALNSENKQIRSILGEKIKEIEPIQQALGKLRNANNSTRGVCSSEEELNNMIRSYEYRIQHESIPLSEEKQILREIKQLESTRPQVIANAAVRAKIQESMVHKESLQDQAKVIGGDLDGVRKEQQALRAKIKQLEDEVNGIDNDILKLQDELAAVTEKRDKARDNIHQFRRQREDENSYYYQSRSILNKARDLANRKDVQALEQFANAEVEHFMSLWNGDKSFRDDYEKRILSSLDARQLSRDGRMRNPDEKPIVVVEHHAPPAVIEALPKRAKEQPKPAQAEAEALPAQKAQKDANNKPKSSKPETDVKEEETAAEPEKLLVLVEAPKIEKVDAAALKAAKRQEEIAKAKMAMERKKKLAEKAAAKAAIRAQKEAEKKIKEREKKLKKKTGVSAGDSNTDEGAEADSESGVEAEKESESVEAPAAAAAPVKERVAKREMTGVRSRGRARGGPDSIAKAILKRKKATNYWLWAAPAATVLTLAFVAIGYQYFL